MQSYAARLFRNTFLKFVSNFSLDFEGGNWVVCLVALCFDNICMVLLISELAKIGETNPIFLDSGSPREGKKSSCLRGHGLLSLYSSYTKFKGKTLLS